MDVTQYGESDYLTAELVKQSDTKIAQIMEDATLDETDYGTKLTLKVEIDGKPKIYRPNKDSIKNLISTYGSDSAKWVGKQIKYHVISMNGKEIAIGIGIAEEQI